MGLRRHQVENLVLRGTDLLLAGAHPGGACRLDQERAAFTEP
jgi:hypothetical protein